MVDPARRGPYVCAYMCIYVHICAYMCIYVRICACMCVYVRVCACMCIYVHICAYMCIYSVQMIVISMYIICIHTCVSMDTVYIFAYIGLTRLSGIC